jgi:ubiquinone/menaquinone biosynthesis C-methylase UbiE
MLAQPLIRILAKKKKEAKMTQQHFGRSYGANPAENYEKYFVPAIGAPLAKELIEKADLHKGEKILDVACGTGVITRLAAEQVGPEGKVEGLDVNPGMLAVAKNLAPKKVNIEWIEANATSIPLPDNSFDVVICQLGLQFVDDKKAALKEMHRVLSPGGRLLLNLPGPTAPLFEVMDKALEKHISHDAAQFVETVFSLHDPKEIKKLMTRAGFHDIKIEQETKELHLPAPKDFLWQYIKSTPLAGVVSKFDDKSCAALEYEVVNEWQKFSDNGGMRYEQKVTVVTAKK